MYRNQCYQRYEGRTSILQRLQVEGATVCDFKRRRVSEGLRSSVRVCVYEREDDDADIDDAEDDHDAEKHDPE